VAAGQAYSQLRDHLHTTQLLGAIQSTLYYDQNTAMPSASAGWRGEQLALLALQLHERQTSVAYAELLAAAEQELSAEASAQQIRNLQLLRQQFERESRLDPALVGQLAQAQAQG
jgi:carboxypeptidase Taq